MKTSTLLAAAVLAVAAVPTHANAQGLIQMSASCINDSIAIGNNAGATISYVSGKFVLERKDYVEVGAWYASATLGSFFAELIPARGWRTAVSYGDTGRFCIGTTRIRVVSIEHCIIGGRDFGALCAAGMVPPDGEQLPVIWQPL